MRLAVLKSNLTRMIPILLAALLLIALAAFSGAPATKKNPSDQNTFGSKIQGEQDSSPTSQAQLTNNNEGGTSANDQNSTSTKVSVSVNSNTTNGETTGSASAEVTQNGQTQTFTKDFEEALDGVNFKVDVSNGEFEFRSRVHEHSTSKSSTDQDVKIKN